MSATASSTWQSCVAEARAIGAGLLLVGCLAGCAAGDGEARRADASAFAAALGFQRVSYAHPVLPIESFVRRGGGPVYVMVEGDGAAWETRRRASDDPTPRDFTGLRVAAAVDDGTVIYLGRPCQYVSEDVLAACDDAYWTDRRFAPEVMARYASIVRGIADDHPSVPLRLAGYSGGGVIAAVVAARTGAERVVTLATPLDTAAWTDHHGVSALAPAEDAIAVAGPLCGVRQVHFFGAEDTVVPRGTAARFEALMSSCPDVTFETVPQFSHTCCWAQSPGPVVSRLTGVAAGSPTGASP